MVRDVVLDEGDMGADLDRLLDAFFGGLGVPKARASA
jgi:hypothetical protein